MKRVHHVFEFTRTVPYPFESDKGVVDLLSRYSEEEINNLIDGCNELINMAREGCTVGDEENDL